MIYRARRYDTKEWVQVSVEKGLIQNVISVDSSHQAANPDEKDVLWIAPGLIDLQINGYRGTEFSSSELTEEKVVDVFRQVLTTGVFRFCPTLTTSSPENMLHGIQTVTQAVRNCPEIQTMMLGIHLEGPFISRENGPSGAHPQQFCIPYDLSLMDRFINASDGLIRMMTLSPEYENATEFIRHLTSQNIFVALGHTNATPIQIAQAVDAGAVISTHLCNATHHMLSKKENYFLTQLVDDRLFASLIADGFHLSPMMLQTIFRTKGKEQLILISDQAAVAGLPPGNYNNIGLCDLMIHSNGKITTQKNPLLLAGASFPVSRGLVNMMTIADLSLKAAFDLCSINPAKLMQISKFSNSNNDFLQAGTSADFLIFRIQSAKTGTWGLADTEGFQPGKLLFESIVYKGKNVLI
ncbi:MAG: amidohydrolase family protein [Planctomycetia bacterium]|nr:amidohydrolase family protein [Planctomycetia bacterium]